MEPVLSFVIDGDLTIRLMVKSWVYVIPIALIVGYFTLQFYRTHRRLRTFEVDNAEIGLGSHKLRLKPNDLDRQIIYKIWVELSTRKIGIEINLEDDVIVEVYDSWYSFFQIVRDHLKDVPASKFHRQDTQKIIELSMQILNDVIRPHLTKWQARFRWWYDNRLKDGKYSDINPQDIQKEFPAFAELETDMLDVNKRLISYRKQMKQLVIGS